MKASQTPRYAFQLQQLTKKCVTWQTRSLGRQGSPSLNSFHTVSPLRFFSRPSLRLSTLFLGPLCDRFTRYRMSTVTTGLYTLTATASLGAIYSTQIPSVPAVVHSVDKLVFLYGSLVVFAIAQPDGACPYSILSSHEDPTKFNPDKLAPLHFRALTSADLISIL
jgi:hypothetical protein